MAQVQQLPFGAISPSARPVSAFIQPKQRNIAGAPARPALFGSPGQIDTIKTAGTTFVQGANSFEQLARDLGAFSQAFSATAPKAAAAFAGWQADIGEREAREQIAEAQARLDEEVETSELNRAAANRQVAFEDPKAGGLMDFLNPYRRIGYERGMAKQAGIEIEQGMPGYIAQNAQIDYNTPDQGMAALGKARADWTNQVLDKYGVDDSTPGFSKYVAPRIERASDRAAQALQADRVKWFDTQKPVTIANLIKAEWEQIQSSKQVTYNGSTYVFGTPGYEYALGARLNQVSGQELMTAGLPGQSRGWQEKAFEILAAEKYFNETESPLDYLQTNIPVIDENGEQALDRYNQPMFYSWNQAFTKEDIDAEIKYAQAAYTKKKREREALVDEMKGEVINATAGLASGPLRYSAGIEALNAFIQRKNTERIDAGLPPLSSADTAALYKGWDEANEVSVDLGTTGLYRDEARFFADLRQRFGTDFNGTQARQELSELVAGMPEDKKDAVSREGLAIIEKKETEEDVNNNWGQVFRPMIESRRDRFLAAEYPYGENYDNKADYKEASDNYILRANELVQTAIAVEEGRLNRRLRTVEVQAITDKVLGDIKPEELRQLAPNGVSQKAENERQQTIQSQIESGQTESAPPTPTYDTNQLADIPDRQVVLRQFRTLPILSESAVEQAITQPVPSVALKKAWRDAGAASLWDFVEAQEALLKQQNPEWVPSYTPAQRRQFRDRSLQAAGLEKSIFTTRQLTASRPQLASIQGWIVPTLLEV